MKANPTINNFIQNIIFVDEDKGEIVISLRKLVLEISISEYAKLVDILEDQKLAAYIRDAEQEITYSKQEALRFLEIEYSKLFLKDLNKLRGTVDFTKNKKFYFEEIESYNSILEK